MYHQTHTQKEWLKKATPEEIKLFLSKGPVGCDEIDRFKSKERKHIPMIRGVRLENKFDDPRLAFKKATAVLDKIQKEVKGKTPLDEVALGIDGQNARRFGQCMKCDLRIHEIFHLASILASHNLMEVRLNDSIDNFVYGLLSNDHHHESVQPLIPPGSQKQDFDDDLFKFKEKLQDYWLKNGLFGIAILAAAPNYDHSPPFPWASFKNQWFYAESYDQAFDMAVTWAKGPYAGQEGDV